MIYQVQRKQDYIQVRVLPQPSLAFRLALTPFLAQWECDNNGTLWTAEAYINGTVSNATTTLPAGVSAQSSSEEPPFLLEADASCAPPTSSPRRLLHRRRQHALHGHVYCPARRPRLPVLRVLHELALLGVPAAVR